MHVCIHKDLGSGVCLHVILPGMSQISKLEIYTGYGSDGGGSLVPVRRSYTFEVSGYTNSPGLPDWFLSVSVEEKHKT